MYIFFLLGDHVAIDHWTLLPRELRELLLCACPSWVGWGKWLPPAHVSQEAGLMDRSYSGPASSPCSRTRALCDIDFELLHHVEVENIPVFSRADDPQLPGLLVLLRTQTCFKFLISIKIRRKKKYHHNK